MKYSKGTSETKIFSRDKNMLPQETQNMLPQKHRILNMFGPSVLSSPSPTMGALWVLLNHPLTNFKVTLMQI